MKWGLFHRKSFRYISLRFQHQHKHEPCKMIMRYERKKKLVLHTCYSVRSLSERNEGEKNRNDNLCVSLCIAYQAKQNEELKKRAKTHQEASMVLFTIFRVHAYFAFSLVFWLIFICSCFLIINVWCILHCIPQHTHIIVHRVLLTD